MQVNLTDKTSASRKPFFLLTTGHGATLNPGSVVSLNFPPLSSQAQAFRYFRRLSFRFLPLPEGNSPHCHAPSLSPNPVFVYNYEESGGRVITSFAVSCRIGSDPPVLPTFSLTKKSGLMNTQRFVSPFGLFFFSTQQAWVCVPIKSLYFGFPF